MAAVGGDGGFKVCGLCSQLVVDESMEIGLTMKSFMLVFLDIAEGDLPCKICAECYQSAIEAKQFKDRSQKAVTKLKKKALNSSIILGRAEDSQNQAQTSEKANEASRASKRANVEEVPPSDSVDEDSRPLKRAKPGPAHHKQPEPQTNRRALSGITQEILLVEGPRATRSSVTGDAISKPSPVASADSRRQGVGSSGASGTVKGAPKATAQEGKPRTGGMHPKVILTASDVQAAEQSLMREAERAERAERADASSPSLSSPTPSEDPPRRRGKLKAVPTEAVVQNDKVGSSKEDEPLSSKRADRRRSLPNRFMPPPTLVEDKAKTSRKKSIEGPGGKRAFSTKDKESEKQMETKAGGKKLTAPNMKGGSEPDVVICDDEDEEEDGEEVFPTVGPYQCEICQQITHTKEQFVEHIRKQHLHIVDQEILQSLESDLKKSKRKAELQAIRDGASSAASSPEASNKAGGGGGGRRQRESTVPSSNSAETPSAKLNEDSSHQCGICGLSFARITPSRMARHRTSKACQAAAKEMGGVQVFEEDPLKTYGSTTEGGETAEDLEERTCQFCGKVLSMKRDFPRHYKTKACVAKRYERSEEEALQVSSVLPDPVVTAVVPDNDAEEEEEDDHGSAVKELTAANQNGIDGRQVRRSDGNHFEEKDPLGVSNGIPPSSGGVHYDGEVQKDPFDGGSLQGQEFQQKDPFDQLMMSRHDGMQRAIPGEAAVGNSIVGHD